ncbi:MAG: hypothetical protein U1F24_00630 [Alphaproteobacteria bacterium]
MRCTKTGGYVAIEDRGIVLRGADGRIERVVGTLSTTQFGPDAQGERTSHLDRGQMRDAIDAAIDWAVSAGLEAALLMVSIDALGTINDSYGLGGRRRGDRRDDAPPRRGARPRRRGARPGRRQQGRHPAARLRARPDPHPGGAAARGGAGKHDPDRRRPDRRHRLDERAALPSGATTSEIALMRAEDAPPLARQRPGRSSLAIYDASPEREGGPEAQGQHRRPDHLRGAEGRPFPPRLSAHRLRPHQARRSYEALIRMLREDGSLFGRRPGGRGTGPGARSRPPRAGTRHEVALRAPALKLGVNVSGMNVGDEMWMHTFNAYLAGDRSLTSRLTIEVTETAALHDIDGIRRPATARRGLPRRHRRFRSGLHLVPQSPDARPQLRQDRRLVRQRHRGAA